MNLKSSYNSSDYKSKDVLSNNNKDNYSSRLLNSTPTNNIDSKYKNTENKHIRKISSDATKIPNNKVNNFISTGFNSPKDGLSNLIYQQVEGSTYRPVTSSPYNSSVNRDRVNSPLQELRSSHSNVSPSNKINSQNYNLSFKTTIRYLPENRTSKKTLILDLDETLVHSSFKPLNGKTDILLKVELERRQYIIHVLKRPGAQEFLEKMAKLFDVVIFTASLSAYANPLINQLDTRRHVSHRLFREHCTSLNGMFIKDMKKLGRHLKDVIIVDVYNF